ncbi:hypothetical protein TNCT_580131 [Trichonephila clavata]|uniref:Uncharacterized protein n=1 Tax=Trichonephila clavata TaxID=2740835 RepID=A0A8X6J3X1_TRICU|nr:hypothetical protein TNCT_580131 [Trichonephila clavata]
MAVFTALPLQNYLWPCSRKMNLESALTAMAPAMNCLALPLHGQKPDLSIRQPILGYEWDLPPRMLMTCGPANV